MALTTKSFTQLVNEAATVVQGYARQALDLSPGSVLRAILEASSATVLWLQSLVLQLLATTRAATSSGADLDSWMKDFGLSRLAAIPATGLVSFSRFTATAEAVIPVGTTVQTADGTETYVVVADSLLTYYSAARGAYVLPATVSSAVVAIQAVNAGAASNAVAGAVSVITTSLPGIDTVTNAAGLTNGADAESDEAFRTRFQVYLQSLSKATKGAIGYAVTSYREGLTYSLVENENKDGSPHDGFFYVVVDDGSGAPSDVLLAGVYNAIDAVRAFTVTFAVFAPDVTTADVQLSITTATGYDHATVSGEVTTALQNYVNTLPLGRPLNVTRLAQIAYDTSPGVTNVNGILVNGATVDLAVTPSQVIKAGLVTVN
jgi:uncharacterized phage protein gp47/JayE